MCAFALFFFLPLLEASVHQWVVRAAGADEVHPSGGFRWDSAGTGLPLPPETQLDCPAASWRLARPAAEGRPGHSPAGEILRAARVSRGGEKDGPQLVIAKQTAARHLRKFIISAVNHAPVYKIIFYMFYPKQVNLMLLSWIMVLNHCSACPQYFIFKCP